MSISRVKKNEEIKRYSVIGDIILERDIDTKEGEWCKASDITLMIEQMGAMKDQIKKLTDERDLALAHDTQPYPTAEAYELVCLKVQKLRESLEHATLLLNKVYNGGFARTENKENKINGLPHSIHFEIKNFLSTLSQTKGEEG